MSSIDKLITSRRKPEEEFMDLPKLWFREIRPSLGEDKKISSMELLVQSSYMALGKWSP